MSPSRKHRLKLALGDSEDKEYEEMDENAKMGEPHQHNFPMKTI